MTATGPAMHRHANVRAVRSEPRNRLSVPSVQGIWTLEDNIVADHPMAQEGNELGGVLVYGAPEEDDTAT